MRESPLQRRLAGCVPGGDTAGRARRRRHRLRSLPRLARRPEPPPAAPRGRGKPFGPASLRRGDAMNTLIDLVTEGAQRHDRRPALLIRPGFRTRVWRYRDLADVVPRAARILADVGLERGERYLVWAVNRPEWSIGWFAGMHLGAVAVPLDVRHTDEFAAKVARQTDARAVLASRQTEKQARLLGLPIGVIETLPDLARHVEPIEPASVGPEDLAEIVF